MIESLLAINFQSHKRSEIKFHPGVNAIVGISDHGKSALLRALHWNRENQPTGTGHISKWVKDAKGKIMEPCEVTVKCTGGTVSRIRSESFNGYKASWLEKPLEAVGASQPQEIADAFNFGEVNVHEQHDAPFLLSKGGAEVARFFNKVVNLEEMGQLMSTAEKSNRDQTKELKTATVTIKKLDKRISDMGWIEPTKVKLALASVLEATISDCQQNAKSIADLGQRGNSSLASICDAQRVTFIGQQVETANAMLEWINSKKVSSSVIARNIRLATDCSGDIANAQKLLGLEPKVLELGKIGASISLAREQSKTVGNSVTIARAHGAQIKASTGICDLDISGLSSKEDAISVKKLQKTALLSATMSIKMLIREISVAEKQLEIEPKLVAFRSKWNAVLGLVAKSSTLKSTLGMASTISEKINTSSIEIAALEANAPKSCPTCGQVIKHSH